MMLDRDQLIKRVAEKHRLILTEDDPLIASVTLHEVIFENYNEQLIQRMDEQNSRVLAALQTIIRNARADQKKDQEKMLQTMSALYQKSLADYEKVTENSLALFRTLADESRGSKCSAKLATKIGITFGILFFFANLYLLMSR
ncbi:MAG: hypothetical protein NTX25_22855 [Proteobacteria bacterium]|nr:hypothetical protein [Pseudomonadota bacterium]